VPSSKKGVDYSWAIQIGIETANQRARGGHVALPVAVLASVAAE